MNYQFKNQVAFIQLIMIIVSLFIEEAC